MQLRNDTVYLPFVLILISILFLALGRSQPSGSREGQHEDSFVIAVVMLAVCSALFIIKGLVRVSPEHMVQADVCSVVLFTIATAARSSWVKTRLFLVISTMLLIAIPMISFSIQDLLFMISNINVQDRWKSCVSPSAAVLRCFSVSPDMLAVARFIDDHTSENEKIYVGPGRHDKIFVNDVALYFVAQRTPGTKWYDSHPGVQTTLSIQNDMVADLNANHVRFIVQDTRFDDADENNDSRISSKVFVFDDFVRQNYVRVFSSGTFSVLEREVP